MAIIQIAAAAGRIAVFFVCCAIVWWLGIRIAGIRGKRPANVIWYGNTLFALGLFLALAGFAAILLRLTRQPGWDVDGAWWAAAACFAISGMIGLTVFRYRLLVLPDEIIEKGVIHRSRRIAWSSVRACRPYRNGSIVLELNPAGRFAFAPSFKEGTEALYQAIELNQIPLA